MARELFMPDHPWFRGIVEHGWTREQIVLGEIQHYLRVRTNPIFFGYIVTNVATERNYALMDIVMENFMEALGGGTADRRKNLSMPRRRGIPPRRGAKGGAG